MAGDLFMSLDLNLSFRSAAVNILRFVYMWPLKWVILNPPPSEPFKALIWAYIFYIVYIHWTAFVLSNLQGIFLHDIFACVCVNF